MFHLAPYRPPSSTSKMDASSMKQLSKEEILSVVDLSTQEAQQTCSAASSKEPTRTFERTDPVIKELTTALDELFCHKLKVANRRYWPAVKDFLSRMQIEELVIRWGPKSERGYSLAWLFHSLNEATLEYQLLSFRQGRHVLLRFYDKTAYVLDPGLLETVARFVARLNDVHFDFRPPDQGIPPPTLNPSIASIPAVYGISVDERVPIARPATTSNGVRSSKGKRPPKSPNGTVQVADPAVAENGPSPRTPAVERRRLKKATNAVTMKRGSSGSQTGTPLSSTPLRRPDLEDSLLSSGRDQDFLFREVLDYNRRTSPDGMDVAAAGLGVVPERLTRRPSAGGGQPELTTDHAAAAAPFQRWFQEPVLPPPKQPILKASPAEDFDEALRKRLTAVKFDQASNFSDSWDKERVEKKGEVDKDEPKENGVADGDVGDWKSSECQEGEIILESGEIVRLAVQVFVQEGERFYKLFRVYLNHNTGAPLMRWLLLTNYAMYMLTRTTGDTFTSAAANRPDEQIEQAELERTLSTSNQEQNYEIDKMTPLQQMEYISVGLCSHLFTVVVRDKTKSVTVCTASEMQTRSILSSLELAVRRCSTGRLEPPSVLTDATPQRLMLTKWAKSELDTPTLDIVSYALVYWRTTPTGESDSSGALIPSRAGYLYHRRHFPKAWLQTNTDWQHSYFMLRGQKLYQFSDSSCKFGEKVFDLRHDVTGCRETQLKDHQNAFEFVLPDEEETTHFSCQTKHDAQQWTQAVLLALSTAGGTEEDEVFAACFALLTTTHLLLGQESTSYGFVRSLANVALNQVERMLVVRTDDQNALAVTPTGSKQRYWLLFRTSIELDRFISLLHEKTGISAIETAQDSREDSLIDSTESSRVVEQCMDMADVWRTCAQF